MKPLTVLSLAAAAVVVAGCVVTSVSPFYTQKDLVYEPALAGNWINLKHDSEIWRFEQSGARAYRFTLIEDRKATVMDAHTFRLEGQLWLDIFSLEEDFHVIPAHYLLKVTQLTPTLQMSQLDNDWLLALLEKDPKAVRHQMVVIGDQPENRRVVLTGDTEELQKFVTKYLKTADAWKDSFEFKRETPSPGIAHIADQQ